MTRKLTDEERAQREEARQRERQADAILSEMEERELAEAVPVPAPERMTLGQTIAAMGETVVTGNPPPDFKPLTPEEEAAERMLLETGELPGNSFPGDGPSTPSIMDAFDRGARLSLSDPPSSEPTRAAGSLTSAQTGKEKGTARARSRSGRPPASDELTSLFAAGFIALVTFSLGEDFSPTAEESTAIARPLGNIFARRIDLAAKLGADANDTIALATALIFYGVRVGPIAADKVREASRARSERTRINRIAEPPDRAGTGGMAPGHDGRANDRPNGAGVQAYDPIHALAQAGATSLGAIDRDFGYAANGNPAVPGQRGGPDQLGNN